MVVVVPAFAHGEDAEEEVVAALVGGVELAAAEGVADGVHGPGDVLVEEETDESAPDQTGESAEPSGVAHELGRPGADEGGEGKAGEDPKPKGVVDENNDGVLEHGPGVLLDVGLEVVEDPADMGVPETFEGGMRVTLIVRVGVVLGVGGGPVKGGPLHGHGTGNQEDRFQPRLSLEGLVGEHPVEAKGDPESTNGVHGEKEDQIHPVHPMVPKQENGADDSKDGKPDQGQQNEFRQRRGRVGVGDGCAQAVSFAYIPKGGK